MGGWERGGRDEVGDISSGEGTIHQCGDDVKNSLMANRSRHLSLCRHCLRVKHSLPEWKNMVSPDNGRNNLT